MSTIDWVAGILVLVFFVIPSWAILINMHMEARRIDREYKEQLAAHGIMSVPDGKGGSMNHNDVIRWAREADLHAFGGDVIEALERFAALVAAAEREELARFFEDHWRGEWADFQIAAAIRARGQE